MHVIGDAPAAELAYTVTVATLAIGFALLATAVSSSGAGLGFLPQALGELYKERNRVERLVARLKQFRRIATRYKKTAESYLAMLTLAASLLWL